MPDQPTSGRHLAPSTPPGWLVELLAILDERRVMAMRMALGILVGAFLLSAVAPSVLPPSLWLGFLVGLAAAAIAAGIAFALDAADPVVKGPRHVRASGTEVLVDGRNIGDTAELVAERLGVEVATSETGTYGVVELGAGHALTSAVSAQLGQALASQGHRVIHADLTVASEAEGVAEVVAARFPLARAVEFSSSGMTLAQIAAGRDVEQARRSLPAFLRNLPGDIDAVLVSLPPIAEAADVDPEGLQRVFVLAVRGVTRRLELLSTLEKYDADGRAVHVLLIDPRATHEAGPTPVAPLVTEPQPAPVLADLQAHMTSEDSVPGMELPSPDPDDITAPVPRVQAEADAFDDDPAAALATPDGQDGPLPLSPELAARLQRQQQLHDPDGETRVPTAGGWSVRPPGPPEEPAAPTVDDEAPAPVDEAPAPAAETPSAAPSTVAEDPEPVAPAAEAEATAPTKDPDPEPVAPAAAAEAIAPTDDLDPELLAAAFATGELDDLDDLDDLGDLRLEDELGATDGASSAPTESSPTAAGPARPDAAITGGLGREFRQELLAPAGQPPDFAPDDTVDLRASERDIALRGAEDDDDPLGMTAALHSFTLERMDGGRDDDANG